MIDSGLNRTARKFVVFSFAAVAALSMAALMPVLA